MIFDKSIKKGKLPFSCIDCIKARKFFDKEGYFTNDILEFTKPNFSKKVRLSELYDIDNSVNEAPFQSKELGAPFYKYFLPKEWVKEEEKKYKPFTLGQWINLYDIGDIIHFRDKKSGTVFCSMYTGNACLKDTDIDESSEGILSLGGDNFTLEHLFEDYEIEFNGKWIPFGIEVEE